ncbi:type IV toxin-antitoxin system AbiEi family antitoxin domain-containing protein [Marihabitans asiaticum]|uniref:Very-short-patch-repair endonuclease n=1 Tax=Marihabitans asiaticum TaxID=415218 RepID=A0A560WCR7_9MICO|nr:DUF559 domain-containing protein [Marihabitans asiaticum]TWD15479.1 very-short-patch-repair endonuclease [Marihabitans asiaticum]
MPSFDLASLGGVPIFSTAVAADHGMSGRTLHQLTAKDILTRLLHGWYTALAIVGDEHRHLLTALAAVAQLDERCVASHHSALVLHGLPVHQVDLRRVYLERSDRSHGRTRTGVVVRSGRSLRAEAQVEGWARPVPTVSVADACILSGAEHGATTGLVAADAALRRGLCDMTQLAAAIDRAKGYPGIEGVRAIMRHADGRHESPGETLTGVRLRATGLNFEPQVEIETRTGTYRVDFLDRERRLIAEFDGLSKYATAEDLVAEKIREDSLRALGYTIVRIVWRDLFDETAVAAKIHAALVSQQSGHTGAEVPITAPGNFPRGLAGT